MGRPATDKRERLIRAAVEQFHQRGYARTALADVAKAAGVPAGNVFYYFRAKDDLARAVVQAWCGMLAGYLAALEPEPDPWARLDGFVEQAGLIGDLYVTWGCPMAGLARDLRQAGGSLAAEAGRVHAVQSAWLEVQFRRAGLSPAGAEAAAAFLMAGYHGAILLAHAQGSTAPIARQVEALKGWLRGLRRPEAAMR